MKESDTKEDKEMEVKDNRRCAMVCGIFYSLVDTYNNISGIGLFRLHLILLAKQVNYQTSCFMNLIPPLSQLRCLYSLCF